MDNYSDIINLSRPVSKRPRMTLEQRSAQFAPFAALTGYEGQVKETARLTNKKIEINEKWFKLNDLSINNEELKEILNQKIQLIQKKIKEQPKIEITYFIPDFKKDGGRYETICNTIQKIDIYTNEIIMLDGTRIDIDDIIDIQGKLI